METESRSVSRDPEEDAGASTDDGGGDEGEEAGRAKACTECKLLKASTEVGSRPASPPAACMPL